MEQLNDKYYITYTEYSVRKIHKNSLDNLTPFNTLTKERKREIAIKGNKASVLKRNENRLLNEIGMCMLYFYEINHKLNKLAQKKHVKKQNLFDEENYSLYTSEELKDFKKIARRIIKYQKDITKLQAKVDSLKNCMS